MTKNWAGFATGDLERIKTSSYCLYAQEEISSFIKIRIASMAHHPARFCKNRGYKHTLMLMSMKQQTTPLKMDDENVLVESAKENSNSDFSVTESLISDLWWWDPFLDVKISI